MNGSDEPMRLSLTDDKCFCDRFNINLDRDIYNYGRAYQDVIRETMKEFQDNNTRGLDNKGTMSGIRDAIIEKSTSTDDGQY